MYQVIGGDKLQRYHLKSVIMGDQLDGLTPADGLTVDAFRAISSADQHRRAVEEAMAKIEAAGPVGATLAAYAKSTELDILCWPGLPGEMLCPAEVAALGQLPGWDDLGTCTRATIMWDPYKCFPYFTRHNAQGAYLIPRKPASWAPGDVADHERAIKAKDKFQLQSAIMPSWIVLAHELGHYCHWRTRTGWFENCLRNAQVNIIEARNLEDHEMPILDHAKLPFRYLYQDFKGGSNDSGTAAHGQQDAALYSPGVNTMTLPGGIGVTKSALDSQLAALKRAKAAAQARVPTQSAKNLVIGGRTCFHCNKSFSSVKINFHGCPPQP